MQKRYPSGILATCCIPWNEDGTLAEEIFRRTVRRLVANLTPNLYILGTAGEGYAVSERQFDQISHLFWEEMSLAKANPMLGIISLSLGTILERIQRAHDIGFRHFQISLPAWGALNDRELRLFFERVCGGFPDCSFLHYNLMRTKRLVTPKEYAILANDFPNLAATKQSTDSVERIAGLMTKCPQLQHFFTEPGYAHAAMMGECGLLISVASINYRLGKEYFAAGRQPAPGKLQEMHREIAALTKQLITSVGETAHMDGAYDKMFCKIHDPEFPMRLLSPYSDFGEESFQKFQKLLREGYPHWLT